MRKHRIDVIDREVDVTGVVQWKSCPPQPFGITTKRQKERFGSRCLSSGRAFLACGSKGGAFVLNFFLHDDTAALKRLNVESERSTIEVLLNESKAKTDAELSRWKEVYLEYEDYVGTITFNNLWTLQMPYFWPIPPTNRQSALDNIAPSTCARSLEKLGYKYKDANVFWRHDGISR
jgi:hypothetical protein